MYTRSFIAGNAQQEPPNKKLPCIAVVQELVPVALEDIEGTEAPHMPFIGVYSRIYEHVIDNVAYIWL